MPGQWAGSPVAVYARVQCREPKTGQQKVQLPSEDETQFARLGIIFIKEWVYPDFISPTASLWRCLEIFRCLQWISPSAMSKWLSA